MYLLSDYYYDLPKERIAQVPALERDGSRLLRLDKNRGDVTHHYFRDVENLLRSDDLLIINNTKVVPARLKGKKETGGKIEVLIIDYYQGLKQYNETGFFKCDCLIRASKSPKKGAALFFDEDNSLWARVENIKNGIFKVKFFTKYDFPDILRKTGEIPLPPYIKRNSHIKKMPHIKETTHIERTGLGRAHIKKEEKTEKENKKKDDTRENASLPIKKGSLQYQNNHDKENYQTVYAEKEGAVAAPTAGLHFTQSLMERLEVKGIEFAELTLHVGYGTFVPVRVNDIRDHKIHSEFFSLSSETAEKINMAKKKGRRIVAVGTTSVRTLEFLADENGRLCPESGMCNLFIYPGYKFKIVDAMITNFHLPESTLLMLVSAFAGRKNIIAAYEEAVKEKYRFFSYGDAMLID